MKKLKTLYFKNEEVINYIITGGLTTLVSLLVYYFCVKLFLNPNNGVQLQIANIISWICAVTFAYFTNRKYVFKSKDKNILKEGSKFYSSRILTLLLDMLCMFLFVTVFKFNDKIIKILVQVLVIVANYIISKFFVFTKNIKKKKSSSIFNNFISKISDKLHIDKKYVSIIVVSILFVSIIPLLIMAFYNFPCADDYTYALETKKAVESIGFLGMFSGAWNSVISFYTNWQGTYSAAFIMALQPAVISQNFYFISTFILMFSFIISTALLLKVIIKDYLKLDNYVLIIISSIIMFLQIQFLPSLVQGFYWWNGSTYYTLFYSFELLLFYLILKNNKNKKLITSIFIIFLSFIIGGGNYITVLNCIIIMTLLLIYLFVKKKEKKTILIAYIFLIIGFAISVLAPGNAIRQANFVSLSPLVAIIKSFIEGATYISRYTTLRVIISLIIIESYLYSSYKRLKFKFKYPLLVTIILFCIFSALFTPPLYAMNYIGEGRLINVIYYEYFFIIIIFVYYWIGFIRQKIVEISDNNFDEPIIKIISKYNLLIMGVLMILMFYNIYDNKENMSFAFTTLSLKNGEARIYKEEMNERFKLYNNEELKDIKIQPLKYKPKSVFFNDITENEFHWRNSSLSSFYHKKSVVLIKKDVKHE